MKKIIVGTLIALVVLVVLAVLGVGLFLDKAIKSGVETFGPKLTKVDVKLGLCEPVIIVGLRQHQRLGGGQSSGV